MKKERGSTALRLKGSGQKKREVVGWRKGRYTQISRKRVSGKEASNSYAMLEFVVSSS